MQGLDSQLCSLSVTGKKTKTKLDQCWIRVALQFAESTISAMDATNCKFQIENV